MSVLVQLECHVVGTALVMVIIQLVATHVTAIQATKSLAVVQNALVTHSQ